MAKLFLTQSEFEFFPDQSGLLKKIIETNAAQLDLFLPLQIFKQLSSALLATKKILPDLKIHLYLQDGLFIDVSNLLENNIVDSLCFGITLEQFKKAEASTDFYDSIKRIYYEGKEFIYRGQHQKSLAYETLLVLMPAWNNDFAPNGLAHILSSLEKVDSPCLVLDLNNIFWRKLRDSKKDWKEFHNVLVWSQSFLYEKHTQPHLGFILEELQKHITSNLKFVGFSIFITNTNSSIDALKLVKSINPNIKTFAGGPSCTEAWAKDIIEKNLLDAAIFGEGEATAQAVIQRWKSGSSDVVAGAMMVYDGKIVRGPERPLLDFSEVPIPDFSQFQVYTYDTPSLPIYSSRGCVAKCSFCSETIYWKKFRALYPESIVNMMAISIKTFGVNSFQFNDSLMNGSHKLLEDFCDLVVQKSLKIEFTGYMRFDKKLTPELIEKLARAGCRNISFGFESGSQKVVDLMNKKVFVDSYDEILKSTHRHGIGNTVCIIVGFPGETWADFFSTLQKVVSCRKYISRLNLSIMEISKNSLIEKDFAKYDIVDADGRYWRTKNYTNFFLIRLTRYLIFKFMWLLASGGDGVSPHNWSSGYIMFVKKLQREIEQRFSFLFPQKKP